MHATGAGPVFRPRIPHRSPTTGLRQLGPPGEQRFRVRKPSRDVLVTYEPMRVIASWKEAVYGLPISSGQRLARLVISPVKEVTVPATMVG